MITLPPFYQQITGTGTYVLCDTEVSYDTTTITNVDLQCKILQDPSLTAASEQDMNNLQQTVEFYDKIDNVMLKLVLLIKFNANTEEILQTSLSFLDPITEVEQMSFFVSLTSSSSSSSISSGSSPSLSPPSSSGILSSSSAPSR